MLKVWKVCLMSETHSSYKKLGKICGRQAIFLLYLIANIKSSVLRDADWCHWSMETALWISYYCSPGSTENHGHQNHLGPGAFCRRIYFWSLRNLSPCKETSPGDNSPSAHPIMQKPVSNLEGLLEEFLSWDFRFPICPRAESPQIFHWWNLSHSMSWELYHLERWCWRNPPWPGKEWPVLSCCAHNFTK